MKRNILLLFLSLCLMTIPACGKTTVLVNKANEDVNEDFEKISSNTESNEDVIVSGPFGSITLTIPDTWESEICDVDNPSLILTSYGIHLKPTAESEGFVEVGYCDSFGVCGTGLKEKKVTIAGHEANIGYYDGNTNWNFISWFGEDSELRNIVVLCSADWGADYLDELVEILDKLQFDDTKQTGGIGIYQPSSELGIDDGYLNVSARNISSTGVDIVFRYDVNGVNESASTESLYYGAYLPISKKVGNDWVELEYTSDENVDFDDVAYLIQENEETIYEYDWEWLYGALEPGEYQIAINICNDAYIYAYFILR